MKKKINGMFIALESIAILVTMILITIVYYQLFYKQIFEDLRAYSMLVREVDYRTDFRNLDLGGLDMRLTIIDLDGQVLMDTQADKNLMENHSMRPEIIEAMAHGEGKSVRHSETLSEDTFYYALLVEDAYIIRVSKDAGSILSIFASALPSLIGVFIVLLLISFLLAFLLTENLLSPIKKLAANLDGYKSGEEVGYEELSPFIDKIQKQHQDIIKNATMRQEFTANVSHELKTPLTSISGYAELIETGMATEEDVARFAHGIHKSSDRLLSLINDIIQLSELDSIGNEIPMDTVDLFAIGYSLVNTLEMNAKKHQVSIKLEGEKALVLGNLQMMEELIYNLCDNAIRYNNPGGTVLVRIYPDHTRAVLEVSDTGIGIPKEHQERIFERFYRVDKSRSKSTGGTGLGLAIVKHIISRHNATMELTSNVGEGTSIRIVFPG